MKVRVDLDICEGISICSDISPVFEMGDDGKAHVVGRIALTGIVPKELELGVTEAEKECPTKAIFIDEE